MSLKNDDIRIAISTILTNVHADYVLTNAVAHQDHKRCVQFVLPMTQTTILASLEEDWWFIGNVLEDRYVTAEFRKRDSFLSDVEIEGRRSHKKQCELEMASTRLGAKALYRESEAKAKEEALNYGDAPYQYSQKEAVDWVNKIILDHSIANAETKMIEGPEGTCVEITFTSWGIPMLVAIDPVWDSGETPKIALFENYCDTPTIITNGAGGYTKPRAIRWFMEKFDRFLTQEEKISGMGTESTALEAEAEKLRGEFNEEIRENEAMAPTDEGTLVGNLDRVRKADKLLEKAEENCVKDIQDKAVELAEERGYTETAEKIKSEGLFSEMKKCQLKSVNNCKLCCFGKSCPQSLLNAAIRHIKAKPKVKKVESDPNWLNVSDSVEAVLTENNISFSVFKADGLGNSRISAHGGDIRMEILFKVNQDLTNDVTIAKWRGQEPSPYEETMIPVRDLGSCNYLLNTLLHYLKDMKEPSNA